MRKISIFLAITLLAIISAFPVLASSEATVTAIVTPELISVTLTDDSPSEVDYGVLGTSVSRAIPSTTGGSPVSDPAIKFENTGNVDERFYFKGADAENTSDPSSKWLLRSTAGADQYVHEYGTGASPVTFDDLTTDHLNNLLGTISPAGTSVEIHLRLSTPTTISDPSAAYSTSVTLVAVKA